MIFKQCISVIVCISLLSNQMLFAGSLDLDKSATQKTSLDTAPNGVPIVNITTPNVQGLSHNKFTNYNVDPKGLILNNATNVVQTQLAGFIASNPNLGANSAKVILNEVTGTNRSLLNGYTEVAGDQADVIVANPNGISVNGGGFINTPKVTLSTGKPELLNGQVSGFNVSGGDILIEGEGFNANANNQVDLYAKVLTLNAKLYAQSLNIVTGENQIASDGTITSKQAVGTGVSLDSSALGGIYAQRITLVGTDKGVGVNLPPEVLASNGAINISSDGKITFQKATASQSINAVSTSSDIEINGPVSASSDIALQAKESIINNDVITAGLLADGSANTASMLTLQASSITNNKSLYANGAMSLDASSVVENKDTINALRSLHVKTDSLKNSGTILSDKALNIEAQTSIANDGTLSSNKDLSITAQSVDNKGFITTADTLALTSSSLSNTGTINSNTHMNLTLNGDFSNDGTINSATDATIRVNGVLTNNNILSAGLFSDGSINTASTLTIQSLAFTNNAKISSLGDLYINTATLENKNYINASNILYTLADTLNNSGTIYSNAYLILRLTQALTNDGTLNGGKSVDIISNGTLTNTNVISAGLLSDGSTNNAATLSLQTSTLTNTAKIFSHGSLYVSAPTLTNRGYFSAYNALHVNATTLNNYGVLFSGTDMNLWVSDLLYNYENANILAIGNLVMAKDASLAKTKRIVNEKATIETIEGDISLYAETFENKTDGLVKGTKLIGTESSNLFSSSPTKVESSFVIQARDRLMSKGQYQILIGATPSTVCINEDDGGSCTETEIRYNGISEKQVIVQKSYIHYWDTIENDEGYEYIQHHSQQVYDVKYVTYDNTVAELNILLSKFGLNARYGYAMPSLRFGDQGFFYSILDLQGGEFQRQVTVTSEQEYMISKNAPAKLLSGKKLSINADTVTNYLSEISSNDDLKITGNTLNNGSEILFQVDTRTGQYEYQSGGGGMFHHAHYSWAPLPNITTYTQSDAAYSLIYSAKNITGNLATVNNIDIKSNQAPLGHSATTKVTAQTDSVSVAPVTPVTIDPKADEKKITLPKNTNGLFVVSTNPKSKYLVETNPAFASFSNFISSDYMLSRLNYNANATTKRLGDAFYENRLVRDSIFEQTGKRYLDPSIINDSDQFRYLMDNALAIKDDLKLRPYVSLSTEQIAALTKDIVWMEEREVDGQKVLVPVVYIANVTIERTANNGARIVAKEDINLDVENLTNQGDITADGDVAITASKNIYNEGGAISSAENMTLQAGNGVYNISAELSAKALSISASTFQSDIDSQDITRTYANSGSQNSQLFSESSTINVKNDVTIKTAKNLSIIGTNLDAGGDVTLVSTDGDIAISSKTHTDTYDIRTRRGYNKGTSTQEIGSSINADSISMNANNLLINASDITAQNDMNIKADNIAITSGENRVYTDSKYERKGGFMGGGKKTADTSDKKEVVSSTLSAKNLNIDAKSLSIQGSKLTAEQANIASEIIELISLKNSDYESHFSDSSGMMTRTILSKGHVREEVIPALIQVQKQLIINNKDVTNQLQTENLVKTITSQSGLSVEQIKLVEAYAKSEEWDKQMTSLTGMGSIIIAAIVTVCTMGAGTGLVAAAMEGMNAAIQAAVQAAIQSMVVQATTSLVTAAITGNSPVLDASSLIKGAVTAGVLSYTSAVVDSSLGLKGIKPADMSYTQQLERGVANTVVKSTVNSAVYGTDFGDNLKMGLATDVSNLGFRYVGDTSMSQYLGESNDYFKDGGIGKVALHSAVGGASAALMGGAVAAGAVAAGVNELASPLLEGIDDKRQQAISGLIGGIAAGAVGGEGEITRGQTIAQSATEYNRQLHQDEIDFINKNADKYAKQRKISPEQAKQELAQEALRITDSLWASMLGESNPEARAFLTSNVDSLASVTKWERGNPFMGMSDIASNQANSAFYKENVYSGVQKDVGTVYSDKLKDASDFIDSFDDQKRQKIVSAVAKKFGTYVQKASPSQVADDVKSGFYFILEDLTTGAMKLGGLLNSDPTDIAKVYNIKVEDVETLRYIIAVEGALEFGSSTGKGITKTALKDALEKDIVKNTEKAIVKGADEVIEASWKPATQLSVKEADHLLNEALPAGVKVENIGSANALNEAVLAKDITYQAPYLADTKFIDFATTRETQWVRVYATGTKSDIIGNWVMRAEDIKGLSPEQIAQKFSLPQVPDMMADVTVPAGQKMRGSVSNGIFQGAENGGGIQFQIKVPEGVELDKNWFTNPTTLK